MLIIAALVLLAVGAFLLTLGFGIYDITVPEAISALFGHLTGGFVDESDDY